MKYTKTRGFTLIELSIVLVIVGLLISGILVGRDLIHQSELKKLSAMMQQFVTATNAFKTKYGCIPGDCPNATNFFPTTANGDGDGTIRYTSGGINGAIEGLRFFDHIYQAGLISGVKRMAVNENDVVSGVTVPAGIAQGSKFMVKDLVSHSCQCVNVFNWESNYIPTMNPVGSDWLIYGTNASDPRGTDPITSVVDAYNIDVKIDDGKPASGQFTSPAQGGGSQVYCYTNNTDPNAVYNLSETNPKACWPMIRLY